MIVTTSKNRQAEIEVQHIILELQNGRAQHMRHFIDQYYCYRNGYVTNNKADWKKIFWSKFVSKKALELSERKNSFVVKEHAIPIKIIVDILRNIPVELLNQEGISKILDNLITIATITKQEDKMLNQSRLKNKMPGDTIDYKQLVQNPFARYQHVGIEIITLNT